MTYTISELAKIANISTRTLRHYHEIGLLVPAKIQANGYRVYQQEEVDRLQKILLLKNYDFTLKAIQQLLILDEKHFMQALNQQATHLMQQRTALSQQINALNQTIQYYQGEIQMTNQEKFENLKQQQIQTNQNLYGDELTLKYGQEKVQQANEHWQHLTAEAYDKLIAAEQQLIENLNQQLALKTNDLTTAFAKNAFAAHRTWLKIASPFYNTTYHQNLAVMYLEDERFSAYYNQKTQQDSAQLLHDIILFYTKKA